MVSVIIPCYNCVNTIDETLSSLEKQSYKNFEVICVNDGSKDGTKEWLEQRAKIGTLDLRVINKENGGVSSARNCGIDEAKGEYILFLDADDVYHEEFISCLVSSIKQWNTDTAYCRLDRVRDNVMNAIIPTAAKQTQNEAMYNLLYNMAAFGFYCYIYKRSIIQKENIRFDGNTKFGEDREFIWKYLCHCKTACLIDAPMYWYQFVDSSAINSKASWRRTDSLWAVKRTEQYMEEKNCPFLPVFENYMYARDMWAVAKKFAVTRSRELFDRLGKEFDVKTCMKRTSKDTRKLVKLASWLYLIHPMLFYWAVGTRNDAAWVRSVYK